MDPVGPESPFDEGRTPRNLVLLALFTLAIVAAWSTVAVYIVHAAMPFNPIRLPLAQFVETRVWAPQGWGFFTRDPREEDLFVYRRDAAGGAWRPATLAPHSRWSNALGLNRASRARGIESGLLLYELRDQPQAWTACRQPPTACVQSARTVTPVVNRSAQPGLCGDLGLVLQEPVPWAWARAERPVIMPSRIARVEVECRR